MTITFALSIDCSNAAFDPTDAECDYEVARILRELADRVESGELCIDVGRTMSRLGLRDINGNTVGTASYTREC